MKSNNITISIITATYNSDLTIADTIKSVQDQNYEHIEHIIIDGLSTDKTLEIVDVLIRDSDLSYKVLSEKDEGIYDAMNKGIKIAHGDIIGILNSDDLYYSESVLSGIANCFNDQSIDAVFGDIVFVKSNDTNTVIRKWTSSNYTVNAFKRGWHPPHPSFFVRRQVYEKYGLFKTELAVSADFELMLRFIEKYRIKTMYINQVLVKMRYGGESTSSLKSIINGNLNVMKAFKINGIKVSLFYPIYRLFPKLIQFIKK